MLPWTGAVQSIGWIRIMRGRRTTAVAAGLASIVLCAFAVAARHRILESWHLSRLSSESAVTRTEAARSLAALGSGRAFPRLLRLAREEKAGGFDYRKAAAEALDRRGPAGYPEILDGLRGEGGEVALDVFEALQDAKAPTEHTVPVLRKALRAGGRSALSRAARSVVMRVELWREPEREALAGELPVLLDVGSEEDRMWVGIAFTVGRPRSAEARADLEKALEKALGDPSPDVRAWAAKALEEEGPGPGACAPAPHPGR